MASNQEGSELQLAFIQTMILRQLDGRLNPELGFAVGAGHVHVHAGFLPREEKEPETSVAENRRTHCRSTRASYGWLTADSNRDNGPRSPLG
jgi:hypothetical protein